MKSDACTPELVTLQLLKQTCKAAWAPTGCITVKMLAVQLQVNQVNQARRKFKRCVPPLTLAASVAWVSAGSSGNAKPKSVAAHATKQ